MLTPAASPGVDPRLGFALPARVPRSSGHQEQRLAPPCPAAAGGVGGAGGAVIYVPDWSRARARARVLEQLAEGRRRRAAYRAGRQVRQ